MPKAVDAVQIVVPGTYTVTIDGAEVANSLLVNNATASVVQTGFLTLGTALTLTAGTYTMQGGTIAGGKVTVAKTAAFVATQSGGTLDGVTFGGVLDMSQYNANLNWIDGATLTGAATINLTGAYARITVIGAADMDNATVNIGNASGQTDTIYVNDQYGAPATLTFDTALIMKAAGAATLSGSNNAESLINNGTISVGASNSNFSINGFGNVINSGKIADSAGDLLTISTQSFSNTGSISVGAATTTITAPLGFDNSGTISVAAFGDLVIATNSGNFSNEGRIAVAAKGLLELQTGITPDQLAAFAVTAGGTVEFDGGGLLDNSFNTLTAGTGVLLLGSGGVISGGTVNGNAFTVGNGGTLDGVALLGTLNVGANTLTLTTGIDVSTATGAIKVAAGGVLNVRADITTGQLAAVAVATGGTVALGGALDNTSNTLSEATGTFAMAGGTILGGKLKIAPTAAFVATQSGGTLDGVAFNGVLNMGNYGASLNLIDGTTLTGTMNITGYGAALSVTGGMTLAGLNGTGAATINLTGPTSRLNVYGSTTIDNATFNIGNVSNQYDYLSLIDQAGVPATLTLGSLLNLKAAGYSYLQGASDQTLINNGTITAGATSSDFQVQGFGSIINAGKITASAADALTIATNSFSNAGSIAVSATSASITAPLGFANTGSITVGAYGNLVIQTKVFGNTGSVAVGNRGTLTMQAGITAAQLSAFSVAASTSIAPGGTVALYDPSARSITVSGTYTVPGGTLLLPQAVIGFGVLNIAAATTLELGSSLDGNETINFAGTGATLRIDHPGTLNATLAGLSVGDAIDLVGVTNATVDFTGSTMSVSTNLGIFNYSLATLLHLGNYTTAGDQHGGTVITLTGSAYNLAAPSLPSSTIDLGIVHVGDTPAVSLTLTNAAPAGSTSEALDASFNGFTGAANGAGKVSLLAAGSSSTALSVGVSTIAAGTVTGTASLSLVSDGTGIDSLPPTSLTGQTITVTGTVDNYAVPAFRQTTSLGTFSSSGSAYTLNLGPVVAGSNVTVKLAALNAAAGIADLLAGSFAIAGSPAFANSGFAAFSGLGAGAADNALSVTLSTVTAGQYSETITLSGTGSNASGYSGAVAPVTLTIIGTVTAQGSSFIALTQGKDGFVGPGNDTIVALANTLNSRDSIDGGTGTNTLQLSGGGAFDLGAPAKLANIQKVTATEGQAASGALPATAPVITLRDGLNVTLTIANGAPATGNANPETVTIFGGADASTINLGTGTAVVYLDGAAETLNAKTGTAFVIGASSTAGTLIQGNSAAKTNLELTTGGTAVLNAASTKLTVTLDAATNLSLSGMGFVNAIGSAGADTITAKAAGQTLTGGLGADTLNGFASGGDTFSDTSAGLNLDTITGWAAGDVIALTDMIFAKTTESYVAATGVLTVTDGTHAAAITFGGSFAQSNFTLGAGAAGVAIAYHA